MKKKTRKQLKKMFQSKETLDTGSFLTGAATALALTAIMRSRSVQNLEHKVGEKLGEAWPKISNGLSGMSHAASGILSWMHLGSHNGNGKAKSEMKGRENMGGSQKTSESFSAASPRAIRPGRSSRKSSEE